MSSRVDGEAPACVLVDRVGTKLRADSSGRIRLVETRGVTVLVELDPADSTP